MTQREETRQDDISKGTEDETDSIDFENLLLRKRAKEALEESEWSEVVVEDVQVYSGYEFADASVARDQRSVTPVRGTIADESNLENLLEQMDKNKKPEYTMETSGFKHVDGKIVHNGRKVLYRRRKWIIVEARSKDGTYSENFVVTKTPKFEKNDLEDVYKSIVKDIESSASIGSPPDSSKKYLRTDQVIDSTRGDMIFQSILRFGILGSSIFAGTMGAVAIAAATGSFFAGSLFLASIIMLSSVFQKKIYDGWFEVAPMEWIDELPDEAKITKEITRDMDETDLDDISHDSLNFVSSEADVNSYQDGTVQLETPTAQWTFRGMEDGVPSNEAMEIYQRYGGVDFAQEENLPVQVAEYDERIPLGNDQYLSDDGRWVLEADGL